MQNKNILLDVALAIICVFFIVMALSSFRNLRKMELEFNEKKATLVKENLDLKDRIDSLQEIISQKTDAVTFLEKEKEDINNKLSLLKEENKKLNKAYSKLHLSYAALVAEKEEMIKQLEGLKKETASLAERISDLEKSPLVERIREAMGKEENKMIQQVLGETLHNIELIKAGKTVDLKRIVVVGKEGEQQITAPQPEEKEPLPLQTRTGKILSVDEKNNIVVVNMGRKDKIKEGDHCEILKNDENIARGEIINVRYNISAVYIEEIKYKNLISDIKEGDKVLIIEEEQ